MSRFRLPAVGAALVALSLAGLLTLTPAAPAPRAAAADAGDAQTRSGTGRFDGLKVTVSQVQHLRNQVVRITWTGGRQSTTNGRNFFNNYLQIMQCWGDEATPQREKCQYGGIFDDQRGGQATSNREIVNNGQLDDPAETYSAPFPATAVVPFTSVTGKTVTDRRNEFFDSQSTNEIDYGRTSADGTGEEFFEVQTGREAAGLGCGQLKADKTARNCWLVVVPRDDVEVNGLDVDNLPGARLETSPLAASNFANAISFRLQFDPVGVTCATDDAERQVLGNESVLEAVTQWQPALCAATGANFGYSQISDDAARRTVLGETPTLSLVSRPAPADQNADNRQLAYAPVAVNGIGVGLVIERYPRDDASAAEKAKRGTRVESLDLNARLVAKLLTQSYTGAVTGDLAHVQGNPRWLGEDPEFLQLNPEFRSLQYLGTMYSITNPLGLSDANESLWQWVEADQQARQFIDGAKDPWGMKVNPFYKDMDLDRSDFPRADPTCVIFPVSANQVPLCALDHLAYANDFHAAARGAIRGLTLANDTWDLGSIPPRYKQNPAQASGERAVLVVTDTATAARFKISMARLQNADGEFVAPTTAAMTAALGAFKDGSVAGVLDADPSVEGEESYPLTEITYAMTAPRQLDKPAARAYSGLIRYVVTTGQTPGIAPGELPEGYVPLPKKLRAQALTVASLIAARGGSTPTPGDDDADGSTAPNDGGSGEVPVAGPPVDTGSPGSSAGSPTPGDVTPASVTTAAIHPGGTRFILLGTFLLGFVALLSRPLALAYRVVRTQYLGSTPSPR